MNRSQRGVVASAALLVAAILFVAFFARPFWAWATWNEKEGTLDFGIMKITNRPPFPGDARGLGLGLILPIVLAAAGRVLLLSGKDAGGERT
jgi:hypothetical protein